MIIEEKSSMLDNLDGIIIIDPASSMLDSSAFEESKPPKKRGRPAKAKAAPVVKGNAAVPVQDRLDAASKLICRHMDNFAAALGKSYAPMLGADTKAAKALIKTYTLDLCLELNDKFFASQDSFIKNSEYDFGTFKGTVNRLILAPAAASFEPPATNMISLSDLEEFL
jgi:hypothetical protein